MKIDYINRDACKARSLRERCTESFRRVSRLVNEAVLHRVAARLAARPDNLGQRRESVQHPVGTIKQWMYQGAFLMRRLENVRGEFSLTALAYDIKRAITLVGVPGLIALHSFCEPYRRGQVPAPLLHGLFASKSEKLRHP
ncbi:hypothetical protein [Agrobacterium cavarae]|uniref:hypothetical protein n=1 Tax=Agrobacterium cavarae TaxID=2528239 RepID=UPI003EE513AA